MGSMVGTARARVAFVGIAAAFLLLLLLGGTNRTFTAGTAAAAVDSTGRRLVVVLPAALRDSMSVIFNRFNEHWDELGDLNTLEKMLATIRPTQREDLGCLQGEISGDTIRIDALVPAKNLKQLPLAVTGDCTGYARLLGTWHTHPYHADLQNLPVKTRALSAQDLETFGQSPFRATLVVWDADSVDAAAKGWDGAVQHPVLVVTESGER